MSGAWGLFAYDALDYTAAQQWLDRKAAQGWRLKKLYFGLLARFERDETSVILCCVARRDTFRAKKRIPAGSVPARAGIGWPGCGAWTSLYPRRGCFPCRFRVIRPWNRTACSAG